MCLATHCGVLLWALTVSNNGHVPNVLRIVHETTDLEALSVMQFLRLTLLLLSSSLPPIGARCGVLLCVRARYVPPRP